MGFQDSRGMVMTWPIYDYWACAITAGGGGNLFLHFSLGTCL